MIGTSTEADPGGGGRQSRRFPLWPLAASVAMQTLATGAAFSVPAMAPVLAADLNVDGALVGVFISTVYGVGIISALFSPGFVQRYGAIRICQGVLLAAMAMLVAAAAGTLVSIASGAVLIGLAYGAAAPSSTHLLVPRTPPGVLNFVLSFRQIGVPLGGVLAGLLVPPLTLAFGWQATLLLEVVPLLVLFALLEGPRRHWDADSQRAGQPSGPYVLAPLSLLGKGPRRAAIGTLALVSFVYSGLQLCFIAFMTVHLTAAAGWSLIEAGQALSIYQLAGLISRPIWGWVADRWLAARWLLVLHGVAASLAAFVAGRFEPDWPHALFLLDCAIAGSTASGFTGIAYAEWVRIAGERRTEATGLGTAAMFAGALCLPLVMSLIATTRGGYASAYTLIGLVTLLTAGILALAPGINRVGNCV